MKITVAIAIVLLLLACAKDNPFKAEPDVQWQGGNAHPHIEATGTESGGPGSTQLTDLDPDLNKVQDAIYLTFDKDMDPATIIASSFVMEKTDPGSGFFQFSGIEYYEESRTAVLHGSFPEDNGFLLTVTAGGVTDINGNPLDPNRNAEFDGSPWDDARFVFSTGTAETVDIVSPGVTGSFPNTGGFGNPNPNVRVFFENGPMDVSKMTLSNFTLVRTSDSSQVNMEIVSTTPTSFMISPVQDLEYGTKYTARLSASLADSAGNFLDTNGDGYIWPDEPDLLWDFQLEDDSTTHGNPPTLRDAVLEGTVTVRVTFEESVTGDDVVMDASTFTAENIQVSDNIGAVPVVFETSQDPGAVNLQLQRAPQGTATLFLSCNLADQYGNLFDGNGNGMGGSPEEDNWSGDL